MKLLPIFAAVLGTCTGVLCAADTKADPKAAGSHQLSEFHIGTLITGPEAKLDDAKGKAVLIDAWGIHCGPCLSLLPEVEKISKRYKDKMIVVGAHCQDGTDDQVKDVVTKNHLTYAITKGVNGPVNFTGLPHAFIFDTSGKMLFSGSPFDKDFDRALHRAISGGGSTGGSSGNSANDSSFDSAFSKH